MGKERISNFKIEGNDLVYTFYDENNKKNKLIEPLMINGVKNPKVDEIISGLQNDVSNKIAEEQEKQAATYEDVEETKFGDKVLNTLMIATALGILATALALGNTYFSNKKAATSSETTTVNANTEQLTKENDLAASENLENASRYTEITADMLVDTTQKFIDELALHGIALTTGDALTFVTIANLTHIKETNPELAFDLTDGMDAKESLDKVGHIVGEIVTNEVTTKDNTVDWTMIFMDKTDKAVADHAVIEVINSVKQIAAETDLVDKDGLTKAQRIQKLVAEKFVAPNFDKTVGYAFTKDYAYLDGTVLKTGEYVNYPQEDGADFITDAIITGILLGDNTLKNYINNENTYEDDKNSTWVYTTSYGEVSNDLKAISENADSSPNLLNLLRDCQNLNQATTEEETVGYSR